MMKPRVSVDRRSLFLKTCADLQVKLESQDAYELLRSSALIRQLFLDEGSSLVDQVNRSARVRLIFNIVEFIPMEGSRQEIVLVPDGLDPDVYDSLPKAAPARKTVTRDQFFSAPIGVVQGQLVTALDVVRHVAFTMGGIHAGMPKTEQDLVLAKIGANLRIGGVNPAIRIVRAAGKGCVRALAPLRDAVSASLAADKARLVRQPSRPQKQELVEVAKPSSTNDWSVGHQLFCVLEVRGRPTVATVLCSYGLNHGPSLSLSVDKDCARVRLVDSRGFLHDEMVDFNRLPMKQGIRHLLHYEVAKIAESAKWSAVVTLDGVDTSRSVFEAELDVTTTDNVSVVAHRAEEVLAVHEMGHGAVPTSDPAYRRKLHEWARAKYGVR